MKLKFGGIEYTVIIGDPTDEEKPEYAKFCGKVDFTAGEIFIRVSPNMTIQDIANTLLHESLHVMFYHAGLDTSSECSIKPITYILQGFASDNIFLMLNESFVKRAIAESGVEWNGGEK